MCDLEKSTANALQLPRGGYMCRVCWCLQSRRRVCIDCEVAKSGNAHWSQSMAPCAGVNIVSVPAEKVQALPMVQQRTLQNPPAEAATAAPELPAAPEDAPGITAVELAMAMHEGTPGGSNDEGEDFEWEDAVELSPEVATAAGGSRAQPERQDVWTRTHGYKFGRKLGDWSASQDPGAGGQWSEDVDPLDEAAMHVDENVAGPSSQAQVGFCKPLSGVLNPSQSTRHAFTPANIARA